jgi:hypothetical protein
MTYYFIVSGHGLKVTFRLQNLRFRCSQQDGSM